MDLELPASEGLDRDALRALSRRSNVRGLLQLTAHGVLLGLAGCAVWMTRGLIWQLPALLLYGVVLNFSFCALHESVHRTAFASRRLNDAVAWIAGAILILPPEYFRAFHFAHHRYTQDPERDPELALLPPSTLASYLWRVTGIPNWMKRLSMTLRHALTGQVREPFIAEAKRALIIREARVLWVFYAAIAVLSLALHSTAALLFWIVPLVLGNPFLRLYLMAEHTGCPFGDDMYANTRTTYTNGALRLLAWQMPYHVEHHAFPAVPFHALAQVNAAIRTRIKVSAPGYLSVHGALIRTLRAGRAARFESLR